MPVQTKTTLFIRSKPLMKRNQHLSLPVDNGLHSQFVIVFAAETILICKETAIGTNRPRYTGAARLKLIHPKTIEGSQSDGLLIIPKALAR